ncbi:CGNR zinc finger domain-containing protein [Microbacterium sp. AZCO]|uniref:CGNR zinc finger domain-containing protein n=1 Tax=Microbacterium sp. AZCO TaxID=3142976 RepID=UPI0031F3C2D5
MSTRRFARIGGHPALDLANTVDWRLDPTRRHDHLTDMSEALRCFAELHVITPDERAQVAGAAVAHDESELDAVRRLREAVYGVVIGDESAPGELSRQVVEATAVATLARQGDALEWMLPVDARMPRLRMALLTVDLLTHESLDRLARCDDDACGWVFLDRSPRHNRRWCVAEDCGNRNRVKAHYDRVRTTADRA